MAKTYVYGDHDEGTLQQLATLEQMDALSIAMVMADGHLGYQSMPIGGVTASLEEIAPGGAGFDIGCGNWTGQTSIHMSYLGKDWQMELRLIGEDILSKIAIGLGAEYGTFAEHPLLDQIVAETKHIGVPENTIRNQFGSVGAGNHYIDLLVDTDGYIWIALHYGSRKFGHSVAQYYLDQLGAKDGMFSEPVFMNAFSEMGNDYLHDMQLAGQYAMESRRLVGVKIATDILHDTIMDTVENHHNFIWEETHYGERMFITRKGATPVGVGVRSFIGGSMGTDSAIVTVDPRKADEARRALWSAPHGAGRLIGRSQAKGKKDRNGLWKRAPLVTQSMMSSAVQDAGVVRIGGDVDEAPQCYRNLIEDVLPEHPYLQVVELLKPVLVIMNPDAGRR